MVITLQGPEEQNSRHARRIALILEYDGSNYQGFQLQAREATIQGEVERALERATEQKSRIRSASRTDSGTHAKGQVVDFLTHAPYTTDTFASALNFYLPPQVKVVGACEVSPGFNSRKDALSRVYRYTIFNSLFPSPLQYNYVHWVRKPLDVDAMAQGAGYLVGSHDFSSFASKLPPRRNPVRQVARWEVWREGAMVYIEAQADGFLPHQIRKCNGLLVDIGLGKCYPLRVTEVLADPKMGATNFPLLPAKGLCLIRVNYRQFPPTEDKVT